MVTGPQRSETMPGASSSSELAGAQRRNDVGADAALVLAALSRLEQAVRDERAVLGRLRTALGDMAHAIAAAKAVADSETAATLLDEFEHRVDAMIEIAGAPEPEALPAEARVEAEAAPEAEVQQELPPAAETSQVPTVSGVVSQFGSTDAATAEGHAEPPQIANVAMLAAMVEALSAAMPHAAAQSEPVTEAPGPEQASEPAPQPQLVAEADQQAIEPMPEQPAAEPELQPSEAAPESQLLAEPEQQISELMPEPQAAAEPVQMVPVAAVTEPQPFELAPQPAADPEPQPSQPEPIATDLIAPAALPEATLIQETTLLANLERMETRPFPPPEEGTAVIFFRPLPEPGIAPPPDVPAAPPLPEPVVVPEATPEHQADAAPEARVEPVPAAPEAKVEPASAGPEFDPTDFLFGPEPEPDPAAFLLDPAPAPPPVPRPPQPDATIQPAAPEAPDETPSSAVAPSEPAPHDPLRALKAMSPEERLAIFS